MFRQLSGLGRGFWWLPTLHSWRRVALGCLTCHLSRNRWSHFCGTSTFPSCVLNCSYMGIAVQLSLRGEVNSVNKEFAMELVVATLRKNYCTWVPAFLYRRESKWNWHYDSFTVFTLHHKPFFLHRTRIIEISISSPLKPLDLPCLCPQISFSHLIIQCLAWHGVETLLHTPSNTKNLFAENKCLLLPFLKFL